MALEQWYIHVRQPFFQMQEFGRLIFTGLLEKLAMAKKERIKRLQILSEKVKTFSEHETEANRDMSGRNEFYEKFTEIEELFSKDIKDNIVETYRNNFLVALEKARNKSEVDYVTAIQSLRSDVTATGTLWLQSVVDTYCEKTKNIMPSFNMFGK